MRDVLVVVPVLLPPVRNDRALAAYDYPVTIIDNTPDRAYARYYPDPPRHWTIIADGTNRGVSRSWNYALDCAADLALILSSSLYLGAGLADLAHRVADAADEYGCLTEHAFHASAWSRRIVDTIGRFDENYWPGWYEDNDWVRRLDLSGIHTAARPIPKIDVPGSETEYGRSWQFLNFEPGHPTLDHAIQRAYYAAKWGGVPGEETYDRPFGLDVPLSYWPEAPSPAEQARAHELGVEHYRPPRPSRGHRTSRTLPA